MSTPIEINTASGWQSIEVYDPGTFGFEPVEVYTQNGWKVPYITDPSNADTPIEINTAQGWKGINTAGYQTIDDFEDNDLAEYTIPSSSGTASVESGSLGTNGNYKLQLDQYVRLFSMDGDGLPNYPEWDHSWEFYFRPTAFHDTPAFLRFNFMNQDYSTNDCYRLEWESNPTSGSDWSLEKRSGGSNVIREATGDDIGVDTGVTYRCEVHWSWSDGTITAEWWNHDTNTQIHTLTLTDSSTMGGSAISFETNAYMSCEFDTIRELP